MGQPLRLDQPDGLPSELVDRLASLPREVLDLEYMDHVLQHATARQLAGDIEVVVHASHVRAYHCTRLLDPSRVRSEGLRILDVDTHTRVTLATIRDQVPVDARMGFDQLLARGMPKDERGGREGVVWFCMSPYLVMQHGTEDFFRFLGGEAIYRQFERGHPCLAALEDLGEPTVVEVAIPARDFATFREFPFARDIMSHALAARGGAAAVDSLDAPLRRSVRPDEVVRVYRKQEFCAEYGPSGGC